MSLAYHNFIVLKDGAVKGAGLNNVGQLGINSRTSQSVFTNVPITNVKQIACGNTYTMFLLKDGTVKGCGNNSYGQLGIGNKTEQLKIVDIPITNVKQVACGGNHTIFLLNDGTAKGVGYNSYGQLGIGNQTSQLTIVDIPIVNVKQVACGDDYTMFLLNDGAVKGCGRGDLGQLGNRNTANQSTIVNVLIANVKQVACGNLHTVFLLNDGTVKCAGRGDYGQLGNGNATNQSTIVDALITNVKQVACGILSTMFLLNDGTVYGCGSNSTGQLGIGSKNEKVTTITKALIDDVKQISCASYHTLFLIKDNTVKGVGLNGDGQLGTGGQTSLSTPTNISVDNVKLLSDVLMIYLCKTFILHNGEYGYIADEEPEQPAKIAPLVEAIPNLTSSTSKYGTVFASYDFNNAYKVFNGEKWYAEYGKQDGYIGFVFNENTKIYSYDITNLWGRNGNSGHRSTINCNIPTDWTFEYSLDTTNGTDGTWFIIDTQTNQIRYGDNATINYKLKDPIECKWFKINYKTSVKLQSYDRVVFQKIMPYTKDGEDTPVIPYKPRMFKAVSNTLPTQEQFYSDGMNDLSIVNRNRLRMDINNTFNKDNPILKAKLSLDGYKSLQQIRLHNSV